MENLLFYLIVFLTNIIQTISGFAGTMLAMPLSISLIGMDQARFILNFMGLLVSVIVLFQEKDNVEVRSIIGIIVFMTVGIGISKVLSAWVSQDILLTVYGVVIILFAVYQLAGREIRLNKWTSVIILVAAGIIHGLFVSGGALLVVYAMNRFKEKDQFRANLSLVWVILNSILLLSFIFEGTANVSLELLSIPTIATLLGVLLGSRLASRINQKKFSFFTKCLLLIMGFIIIFN